MYIYNSPSDMEAIFQILQVTNILNTVIKSKLDSTFKIFC